jgi:HlyD family secretion protein
MKRTLLLMLLAGVVVAGLLIAGAVPGASGLYSKYLGGTPTSNFRTTTVKRGDLSITISATGTLEPEEVVDVGAQVVGPILNFGMDPRAADDPQFKGKHIDYGAPVEEGTVLAQIDPAVYTANRDQAKALLDRAKSDLGQLIAHRDQALAEWNRAQKLHSVNLNSRSPTGASLATTFEPIKAISDSDYDLALANYAVAKANTAVGESTIAQSEAALKLAETNLSYTTIKSPVKGTIIDRRVNVGQTVVASLNAPSLFLIAKDLRQIQVWSSVNEADIGRLKIGMPVRFTVDAFPNDVFHGEIEQIRLNATMTQNVVTYTVVITTDNSDLKLLPYLTADVKFEVDDRKDVLLVPNAALRWQPKPNQIAPDTRGLEPLPEKSRGKVAANLEQSSGRPSESKDQRTNGGSNTGDSAGSGKAPTERGTLWLKDGEFVRPIEVRAGPTDTINTEVSGPDLSEGMEVVIGEVRDRGGADATTNPFAPQMFRGNRQGSQGQGQGQGKGPGQTSAAPGGK